MPISDKLVRELPQEVINELAILEDRAIRAEGKVGHQAERIDELQDEVTTLREIRDELVELAQTLQGTIEHKLRHVLVVQAR
jgi:predicted nuclease with TOPRIM domain